MAEPMTRRWSAAGRLFQARIWREYAMAWDRDVARDGLPTIGRGWVQNVLRRSRSECLRRSRVNAYLARRINRATRPGAPQP
jgi:hypothetical protein